MKHSFVKNSQRIAVLLLLSALLLSLCACTAPSGVPAQTPAPTVPPETPAETPAPLPEPAGIRISEYMAKNQAVLLNGQSLFSDWIELENYSDKNVMLSGWHISDSAEEQGWLIPDTEIPAGGYLLIFASGRDQGVNELHADFSLSEGEDICLRDEYSRIIDLVSPVQAETDISYKREAQGFVSAAYPSPGYSNDPAGYELWQQSRLCSSPLVINELMNANSEYLRQSDYEYYDWAEIKNVSQQAVLLSDYWLSDDDDDYFKWQFPAVTLMPGQCFIVICSGSDAGSYGRTAYSNFALSAERDQLFLSSRESIADYVSVGHSPLNSSVGRMDGENGFFHFAKPSPGSDNYGGCRLVAQTPVSLTRDGVYEGVDSVAVTLSAAGDIYYSTDGSLPTVYDNKYSGPIELRETTVVRAVSISEGMLPSEALTLSFIINEGHSLPVISLVTDSPYSFNHMYKNEMKGLELPGSVSLYEKDGSFTINCGVRLSGATSLVLPKKNISVKFRARYGQERLEYDVFDGGISSFSALTMRAGQDQTDAIIRNELCQELCLDSCDAVLTQRSKYCVMYINGRYWGVYALKDKINEQFYADIAGVSKESVTMVEANVKSYISFYPDVWAFCRDNDMSLDENYRTLCQHLDVESLIDWIIIEGFCANHDLRSGNVRYCHSTENDGKWRVVYYDLDCAFRHGDMNYYNLMSDSAIFNQQVSQIIDALFENESFRSRFLEKFSVAISGPLSNEAVLAKIDALSGQIAPEMARDSQRWGISASRWEYCVEKLRSMIIDYDWQQYSINNICRLLDVTEEERLEYFGQ